MMHWGLSALAATSSLVVSATDSTKMSRSSLAVASSGDLHATRSIERHSMMRRVDALDRNIYNLSLLQVDSFDQENQRMRSKHQVPGITGRLMSHTAVSGLTHPFHHAKPHYNDGYDGWNRGGPGMYADASSESSFVSRGESTEESEEEARAHATALLLHEVGQETADDALGKEHPCSGLEQNNCTSDDRSDCYYDPIEAKCFAKLCLVSEYPANDEDKCNSNYACIYDDEKSECKQKYCSAFDSKAHCDSSIVCRFDSDNSKCLPRACSTQGPDACVANPMCKVSDGNCLASSCSGLDKTQCSTYNDKGCFWHENDCKSCHYLPKSACEDDKVPSCLWDNTKCTDNCTIYTNSSICSSDFYPACKWVERNVTVTLASGVDVDYVENKCNHVCHNLSPSGTEPCHERSRGDCDAAGTDATTRTECPLLCNSCPVTCEIYKTADSCNDEDGCKYANDACVYDCAAFTNSSQRCSAQVGNCIYDEPDCLLLDCESFSTQDACTASQTNGKCKWESSACGVAGSFIQGGVNMSSMSVASFISETHLDSLAAGILHQQDPEMQRQVIDMGFPKNRENSNELILARITELGNLASRLDREALDVSLEQNRVTSAKTSDHVAAKVKANKAKADRKTSKTKKHAKASVKTNSKANAKMTHKK